MNKIDRSIYDNLSLLPLDLQGWNGDRPIFKKLISETTPRHIIEVGSWKGQSTITMCNAIKELNLDTKMTCVDTWLGAVEFWDQFNDTPERDLLLKNGYPNIYYQFLSNIVHTNNQNIVQPFPTTSRIAYYYFKRKGITADLIYIDASHEYEDVMDDAKMYFELLNDNGVLFGDDYNCWHGVTTAINEFARLNNLNVDVFTYESSCFWGIKKNSPLTN